MADPVEFEFEFDGEIVEWRGPTPYYFVFVPDETADELRLLAAEASYGWGVVPVVVELGSTRWQTSLFPKDGTYAVPVKLAVRRAEKLDEGDSVTLRMAVGWVNSS